MRPYGTSIKSFDEGTFVDILAALAGWLSGSVCKRRSVLAHSYRSVGRCYGFCILHKQPYTFSLHSVAPCLCLLAHSTSIPSGAVVYRDSNIHVKYIDIYIYVYTNVALSLSVLLLRFSSVRCLFVFCVFASSLVCSADRRLLVYWDVYVYI